MMAGLALAVLDAAGLLGLIDYPAVVLGVSNELGTEPIPRSDIRGVTYQDMDRDRSEPIPFRYRTDRRGFRNRTDRDEADIYLLGDSILVAGLIPEEETIASRLEAEAGRSVMNIALIGIGPQRERDLLLHAGLPLEDRRVLHFIFEGNDLGDSKAYRSRQGAKPSGFNRLTAAARRTLTFCLLLRLQRLSDSSSNPGAGNRSG